MAKTLQPGSRITLAITKAPTRPDDIDTLRRLMRMDPRAKAALDRARRNRDRTLVSRQRGGRQWAVRQRAGKLVHPEVGATWSVSYRPQIAPDLAAVSEFISVKA